MNKIVLLFLIALFVFCQSADATTYPADNASQTAVAAAIALAGDGDTVTIPAGEETWSVKTLVWEKAITIEGAGIGQTIITDSTTTGFAQAPFEIYALEGTSWTVKGIEFKNIGSNGAIFISGTTKSWRVTDCKFTIVGRGIRTFGYNYGVIDHCTFIGDAVENSAGMGITWDGETSWERDLSLGTVNATYIEDCTFTFIHDGDGALDAYNGARYVFRYNTVTGTAIGHHGADSGGFRSTHSFEIYNNTFTTSYTIPWAFHFRGGTGVVYDNILTGDYTTPLHVTNYRSCGSYAPFGQCDNSSNYDGNLDATGWPCLDQIGRSTDEDASGTQDDKPFYEWDNTIGGADVDVAVAVCADGYITEDRDYFNDTEMPAYTPYTYPHPLQGVGLIKVSHINSGGLTISNIGSGNLTISNIGD